MPKTNRQYSQPIQLCEGTKVICIRTVKELDIKNGRRYTVMSWENDILLQHTLGVIRISIPLFAEYFDLAWATTTHKAQGQTINAPYMIHEWWDMDMNLRYTGLSRTTKKSNVYIMDACVQTCTEYADVEAAKYLLSKSPTELRDILKKDIEADFQTDKAMCGKDFAKKRLLKKEKQKVTIVKEYCERVVLNNGAIKMGYKYARGNKGGRLFAIGPCMQRVPGSIRGFLLKNIQAYDIDMQNCHPNILRGIAKELDVKTPYLDRYCDNRAEFLKSSGASKLELLIQINRDKKIHKDNKKSDEFKGFDKDVKTLQDKVWKHKGYSFPRDENRPNKKGAFMNQILCHRENQLLQKAAAHTHVQGLYFDGMMCSVMPDLDALKELTGFTWTHKPHNTSISTTSHSR